MNVTEKEEVVANHKIRGGGGTSLVQRLFCVLELETEMVERVVTVKRGLK